MVDARPSEGGSTGKLCPACGRDVGVWPVFSAGMPTRIWCPRCRARLRYEDAGGMFAALLVALAATALAAWWASGALEPLSWRTRMLWFCGLLAVTWIPIELVTAILLRGRKRLARVE